VGIGSALKRPGALRPNPRREEPRNASSGSLSDRGYGGARRAHPDGEYRMPPSQGVHYLISIAKPSLCPCHRDALQLLAVGGPGDYEVVGSGQGRIGVHRG
jgi:hypothetical protein